MADGKGNSESRVLRCVMFSMTQRDKTEWKNDVEGIQPEWLGLQSHKPQRKTNTVCSHLYVEPEIQNKQTNVTKQKQTQREQTSGYQWGKGWGRGKIEEGD